MKLTNTQIYNYAQLLNRAFQDSSLYLPARINFYIQKNKTTILSLGEEIEKTRSEIIQHYGELAENNMFYVKPENMTVAQAELNDLFSIEQEVNILKFSIDKFTDDIQLSMEQMEAIMFMIEEA